MEWLIKWRLCKLLIKPALNRVGHLLKAQARRIRRLPPLLGRAGVGRIKSITYAYGSEILINVFNEKSLVEILPTPTLPSRGGRRNPLQPVVFN
jgi:hypothetical protein